MTPTPRSGHFMENLALWTLCAALAAGPAVGLNNVVPLPAWRLLGPALWFVAAWGIFSTRLLHFYPAWQSGRTEFRASELVLLAVGLRLFTWTAVEGWPSAAVWRAALEEPGQIVSTVWLVYTAAAVLIWQWAVQFTTAFIRLAITPEERAYNEASWTLRYDPLAVSPVRQDRSDYVDHFQRHWLNGGVVLLMAASLSTFALTDFARDLPGWGVGRLPLPGALLIAMLVYFLLGFYMLGRAQAASLFARWLDDGAQPTADLEQRLRRQLLWVLSAAALAAALLPIGSGAPVARLLLSAASAVATVAGYLLQLFLYLMGALVVWLFGGLEVAPEDLPPTPQPRGEPPDFGRFGPDNPTAPTLGPTIWIIVIVATVAALLVLYSRREDLKALVQRPRWRALWARWSAYWRGAARRTVEVARQLRRALQRPALATPTGPPRRRRRPWGELTPREQIRAVYLAALDLARDRGLARRAGQTPTEFLHVLQAEWPDAAVGGAELTDAFEQARYAAESAEPPDLAVVQQSWQQVRAALKRELPRSLAAGQAPGSQSEATEADLPDDLAAL